MNRNAAERAVAESTLSMGETLTMMMLLRRAHNDTLEIPEWRTPTLPQLAAEVRVGARWQRRMLAHLSLHAWLKVAPGRGRGHKSTYALLPEKGVPAACDCRQKRGTAGPLNREKVTPTPSFSHGKGGVGQPQKGVYAPEPSQVTPAIAPRAPRGKVEGEGLACIAEGCISPRRNACRTCFGHAYLELEQ